MRLTEYTRALDNVGAGPGGGLSRAFFPPNEGYSIWQAVASGRWTRARGLGEDQVCLLWPGMLGRWSLGSSARANQASE